MFPLTQKELERLEELLITYGNDYSVLNLAELDGFFTGLASSPTELLPEKWLPIVSGGKVPKFKRPAHAEAYTALMLRYAQQVKAELAENLDNFEPVFEESETEDGPVIILEEWCFGYMRATQEAQWAPLPAEQDALLKVISLHGLEDNFELLDQMSDEDIQLCVPQVVQAARGLYRYQKKKLH